MVQVSHRSRIAVWKRRARAMTATHRLIGTRELRVAVRAWQEVGNFRLEKVCLRRAGNFRSCKRLKAATL